MKNIIITGASHGIGRAIAKSLRKKYHVINIDIVENKMEKVDFYKCDLSDKSQLLKTIEKIKTNIDSLDVLINNAAIFSSKILEKQTFEEWENIINTNLTAPYILSKEFASFLKISKGHIINISSTRALMSEVGTEAYSASKGGISSLTHALAMSLSPEVKVNSITPGWINTNEEYIPTKNDNLQHPSGRVGTPDDVVDVVKFLLKNRGFITGSDFVVDGGMTKKMIYI
ncbi:MAG: SDR family oxidoreductase [Arcobacter sp.]|jgi:NAD(P)-dependent dehydrogenase (short-subunit alcohol dehydrogenase family)|uniref:SDR family oxidoreductase n=1 Tax=Arcobacter sp. TaxID=1872629 RepID=UPI002590EEFB|nr:SDR family oxidoreductase [Arcobacter sp.]MDD3008287.1 SDR family oxidoreductase [Arcobacter sp.]MDY3204245.1 SDR family oxidoreductase [Arcobacter sp.]